jgi:hypothetical protein
MKILAASRLKPGRQLKKTFETKTPPRSDLAELTGTEQQTVS